MAPPDAVNKCNGKHVTGTVKCSSRALLRAERHSSKDAWLVRYIFNLFFVLSLSYDLCLISFNILFQNPMKVIFDNTENYTGIPVTHKDVYTIL